MTKLCRGWLPPLPGVAFFRSALGASLLGLGGLVGGSPAHAVSGLAYGQVVATHSGKQPKMKASAVITMGRKRSRAALSADSQMLCPLS